ncbi:MAG: fibronectin type III domain-containing protein [Deltaproteobacteria bacterium]|nr:fibronectin type III domain-containing protein [Deltaproteobacteria bacterium]
MAEAQQAVAVNTKIAYAEIDLGTLNPTNQTWTAPYSSDWAIAVGGFSKRSSDTAPPTTPQSLGGIAISEFRIDLAWQAASDPESGISGYKVYRDGTFIGQSSTTSFSDTGLTENTIYVYEVSAVNGAGLQSEKSAPISVTTLAETIDTIAPSIISATTSGDPNKVTLVFSEPVEEASSEDISNYGIDNDVTISGASLASDLKTVVLTTSPHTDLVTYTLNANNIRDRASTPNVIAANTQMTYTFAGQLVISNLTVDSGKAYEIIENGLQIGSLVYIDRVYTFKDVPASLLGATYIKTANTDKGLTGDSFITFEVNQDVTVYVVHDNRIATKPSWMASFTDTGDDLVTTDATFSIFAKHVSAGTVTLGGNEGGYSMYVAIIVAQGTPPPTAPTGLKIGSLE